MKLGQEIRSCPNCGATMFPGDSCQCKVGKILLPGEYILQVDHSRNRLVIGQVKIDVSGSLEPAVAFVRSVFAMGMAARQPHIARAYKLFLRTLGEVIIAEGEEDGPGEGIDDLS